MGKAWFETSCEVDAGGGGGSGTLRMCEYTPVKKRNCFSAGVPVYASFKIALSDRDVCLVLVL